LLRFQLQQLHVPSLGRYFLPLPKLTDLQLGLLSAHLEGRGFSVRLGSGPGKRIALKGTQRIAIDGGLGLAGSGDDVLDALAPAVPELLASPRERTGKIASDGAARYFSLKRSGASVELQIFPRLESLRTWTCLRKDGMCGLTPDEAAVLKHLLGRASRSSQVGCVTARPRQGSKPLQAGRNVYYKSVVPVPEFLSSLRTAGSGRADSASYLPRDSVMELPGARIDARLRMDELGEWCYLG
jgi:hypothetical protein